MADTSLLTAHAAQLDSEGEPALGVPAQAFPTFAEPTLPTEADLLSGTLALVTKHGGALHRTGTPQHAHAGARAKAPWTRWELNPRVGKWQDDRAVDLGALFSPRGEDAESPSADGAAE